MSHLVGNPEDRFSHVAAQYEDDCSLFLVTFTQDRFDFEALQLSRNRPSQTVNGSKEC